MGLHQHLLKLRKFLVCISPAVLLVFGYLLYALIGWSLLSLPWSQSVSIPSLDNLFIAISAISTTGLVTIDPGSHYSFFGQLVLLLLMQLGGLGYMTVGSFITLSIRHKLSPLGNRLNKQTFSLPKDFNMRSFIKSVVVFALIIELIGALALWIFFAQSGADNALWNAVFHSVSAFCTAGFSLFSDSFMQFNSHVGINLVLSVLALLGSIGFIVVVDWYRKYTGKQKGLHFTSKVILSLTFWFILFGTLFLFILEPSIQKIPAWQRLLESFFQVMSASTTVGFNTVDISDFTMGALLVMIFLMTVGASPSGTGGGLKSTTFAALFALVKSTLKKRDAIRYRKRVIPDDRMQIATASFAFYTFIMFTALVMLSLSQSIPFQALLFEVVSAMSTVGLSLGITADLTSLGKLIIIVLMFMGRVGILAFGIAVTSKDESRKDEQDNDLVL